MAAGVRVLGQNRTVLVRSPTLVEDAVEVHAQSTPSNVTFVRVILYKTWLDKGAKEPLQPIADHIEQIVKNHHVIAGYAVQAVDGSGLVTNLVQFVVTVASQAGTPTPTQTAVVTIPVQVLYSASDFAAYFKPVEAALGA